MYYFYQWNNVSEKYIVNCDNMTNILIRNMYTHAQFVVKKDHTITDPSILGKGAWQAHSIQHIY